MAEPLHSEAYLTDLRDGWWNADFLQLMASRLSLHTVRRALDVGCGQGHWTRLVARMLPADAEIVGVEREPEWVRIATERAAPGQTFVVGTAQALPFPDASFDLVTCQTVLIHVPDPAAVLAEMRRVLRPGGRVLLAEPNNLPNVLSFSAPLHDAPVEDVLEAVRLQLMVERGKRAVGEGYNSVGEELMGLLREGWADVAAWNNDRVRHMWPPYDAGIVADERGFFDRGEVGWRRDEALAWFIAAGGNEHSFRASWDAMLRLQGRRLAGIDAGTYAAGDAAITYLVTARREG